MINSSGSDIIDLHLNENFRLLNDQLVLYLVMVLCFAGLLAYTYYELYDCEINPSRSCNYHTCGIKDDQCGYFPYYITAGNEKKCVN